MYDYRMNFISATKNIIDMAIDDNFFVLCDLISRLFRFVL